MQAPTFHSAFWLSSTFNAAHLHIVIVSQTFTWRWFRSQVVSLMILYMGFCFVSRPNLGISSTMEMTLYSRRWAETFRCFHATAVCFVLALVLNQRHFSFQGGRLQHAPSPDRVCGSGYWDGLQLPLPRSDRLYHWHHGADLQGLERQVRYTFIKLR